MLQGEHSAILPTSIKLSFSITNLVLSTFKWPLNTGFTGVLLYKQKMFMLSVFCQSICFGCLKETSHTKTSPGLRSAVSNMSDCRYRGHEFDPGLVPYLSGD